MVSCDQITLFSDGEETISSVHSAKRKRKGEGTMLRLSTEELREYLDKTGANLIPDNLRVSVLNGLSDDYPFIFFKGDCELLKHKSVSIVGTRTPSIVGIENAKKVSRALLDLNFVIVSGLAKGIDTIAHTTTLENNGKTIAVLGTPIHKIYPAENKVLADRISSSGLILSSSLPHEEKGQYLFPRRNRLMARLSAATIVIEAGPTSGVIHQAAECLRQNKKLIFLKPLIGLPWVPGFIKSGALVVENLSELKSCI